MHGVVAAYCPHGCDAAVLLMGVHRALTSPRCTVRVLSTAHSPPSCACVQRMRVRITAVPHGLQSVAVSCTAAALRSLVSLAEMHSEMRRDDTEIQGRPTSQLLQAW